MADDLASLIKDLGAAPVAAEKNIRKAVEFTATEVKKDWQQGAERTGLADYAKAIDYDITARNTEVSAVVGPNPGKKQGRLGLVEDANGDVKSRPQHAGRDALEANEADFEIGLQTAIFDAVLGKQARMGPA